MSGHALYDVKRYLAENVETIEKAHPHLNLTHELQLWTRAARSEIYGPAWEKVEATTSKQARGAKFAMLRQLMRLKV